jgi:hypothetical protein
MSLFQLLAVPFIAAMLFASARNLLKVRARLVVSTLWVLLWLATLMAVIDPDSTTQVARALGIQRGADLLVYSAVLGFIVGFYLVYLKLRQLSREITLLTRELAMRDARDGPSTREP